MHVLIVNPDSPPGVALPSNSEPLSIGYVASYAEEAGYDVTLVDLFPKSVPRDELLSRFRSRPPAVVAFASFMLNFAGALDLARDFKETYGSHIVFGGNYATTYPQMLLENDVIDTLVLGEGEVTFRELLRHLEDPAALPIEQVDGIAYRKNGELAFTAPRERIEDLDSLPFPMREGLPLDDYFKAGFRRPACGRRVFLSILGSRGCQWDCYFCSSKTMWNRRVTRRSVGNIINELTYLKKTYGMTNLYFYDDDVLAKRAYALELFDAMASSGLNVRWRGMGRAAMVDEQVSEAMARSGCEILFIGAESVDPDTSRRIGKKMDPRHLADVVRMLQRRGIVSSISFVIGFPWDSRESVLASYRRARRIPFLFVSYLYATPFPGTRLWDDATAEGLLEETDLSKFALAEPVMRTRHLSRAEIVGLKARIMRGHVLNPTFIWSNLKMAVRDPLYVVMMVRDTWRLMVWALSRRAAS